MLGGACTYISLAASYFTGVNIVAVVGEDFAQEDCDLLAGRGITLAGLERLPRKRWLSGCAPSAALHTHTPLRTAPNAFARCKPPLHPPHPPQRFLVPG